MGHLSDKDKKSWDLHARQSATRFNLNSPIAERALSPSSAVLEFLESFNSTDGFWFEVHYQLVRCYLASFIIGASRPCMAGKRLESD